MGYRFDDPIDVDTDADIEDIAALSPSDGDLLRYGTDGTRYSGIQPSALSFTPTGGSTARTLAAWLQGIGRAGDTFTAPSFWSDINGGTAELWKINGRLQGGFAVETNDDRITGANQITTWGTSSDYANWISRDSDFVYASRKGVLAVSGMSRTSDKAGISPAPSTSGIVGYSITNTLAAFSRAAYFEAQLDSIGGASASAWGVEIVVKNKTATSNSSSPYSIAAGTKGLVIVSGGDSSYAGAPTNPIDTFLLFERGGESAGYPDDNIYRANKGIVFNDDALVRSSGVATAMHLATGHQISWAYSGGSAGVIRNDVNAANSGVSLIFSNNAANFYGTSDAPMLLLQHVTSGVNQVELRNSVTGAAVSARANGSDTNIDFDVRGKGVGVVTHNGLPVSTLSFTAASATSHTGNTTETILKTIAIPADTLGANGLLKIRASGTITSSANNKTIRFRLGGISGDVLASALVYTTNATWFAEIDVQARNSTSSQKAMGWTNRGTDGLLTRAGPTTTTRDTTTALDLVITGELASAGESISVDDYTVEIFKKA